MFLWKARVESWPRVNFSHRLEQRLECEKVLLAYHHRKTKKQRPGQSCGSTQAALRVGYHRSPEIHP